MNVPTRRQRHGTRLSLRGQRPARRTSLRLLAVLGVAAAITWVGVASADPPATFTVSGSQTALQQLTFTATGAGACTGTAECTWSFGDLGGAAGSPVTHTYLLPGTYTVTLTVSDPLDLGADETTSQQVTISPVPNVAPSVTVNSPAGTIFRTGSTFSMTAGDADGSITGREWRVDAGAYSSGGTTFSPTFTSAGVHTVYARVTDNDGAQTVGSAPVTVAPRAPTTSIAGPATLNIGVQGQFSMTAIDPDGVGTITTREWRVDSGAYSGNSANFSHAFTTAGAHTVSARVTDDDGSQGTASVPVTVLNQLPTVDFSWSPKVVDKDDLVTFTSNSVDPDGKALSKQEWDLDGDGEYDDAFGDTATRTYTTSGSRTIGLRVTDADSGVAVGHLVLVPGNRPPTASFTAAPVSPLVGQTVTFTSTSRDSDGRVASLAWDLNGDNVFNEGNGGTASRKVTAVGTQRVGLKVTDDDGSTDVTFINVVVKPASGVAGSSAVKSLKILSPFPKVRFAGALTRHGALIKLLTVKAPKGAKISITCKKGCPRSKLARVARDVKLKSMLGSYRAGAVLVITVTKSNAIGKYTRITVVKGKAPKRIDRCLWPKSKKPRTCPPGVGLT